MITIADVGVRLRGDATALLSDASKSGSQAGTQAGENFGSAFNEAGKRLIKGFIGAELILKSVDILKDAITAAKADALATDQLTQAIKINAGARKDDAEAIERQVAAAQRLGFTDNEVKASLTSLVTATKDLGRATDDQTLAFDLARFKHISLQDATQSLVAVEAGRYRGLAQLGIQIDSGATKEEALGAIRARVAGQAETFANSDAGAAARRDAAYDKLLETIGTKLLPIITDLSNFTTDVVIPGVAGFVEIVAKMSPVIETIAAVIGGRLAITALQAGLNLAAAALAAVGLGTSAGAAVIPVGQLTFGMDAAAISAHALAGAEAEAAAGAGATGLLGALSRFIPVAGAVVVGAVAMQTALDEVAKHTVHNYGDAMDAAELRTSQLAYGLISAADNPLPEFQRQLLTASERAERYASAADEATAKNDELADSTDNLTAKTTPLIDAVNLLGTTVLPGMVDAMANAQTGAGLLSGTMSTLTGNVEAVGLAAIFTQDELNRLSRLAAVQVHGPSADIAGATSGKPGFEDLGQDENLFLQNARQHTADVLAAERAAAAKAAAAARGGGGKSQAEKDADALAASLKDKAGVALDAFKAAATKAMDTLHAGILKNIDSTLKLAQTDHTAALQKINDTLKQQELENNAPVTEAEKAQAAIEDARRARDLQEAIAAAALTEGTDDDRAAAEAEQSYLAEKHIADLRAIADQANATAQAKADADTISADATLTAAQTAADNAKTAEDARYKDQKARFDVAYKAIQTDSKNYGKEIAKALAAGMLDEVPAVEKAATALANAIKKYLKVGSPAEVGPLHDNPPDVMGETVANEFYDGMVTAAVHAATSGKLAGVTQAAVAAMLAASPPHPELSNDPRVDANGNPTGHYDVTSYGTQTWVPGPATPVTSGTGYLGGRYDSAAIPGAYVAEGTQTWITPGFNGNYTGQGVMLPSGQANPDYGGRGGPTIIVNNPVAEPASTSARRRLQSVATWGY